MSVTWYESIEDARATGVPEDKILHEGVVWGVDDADLPTSAQSTAIDPLTPPQNLGQGTDG